MKLTILATAIALAFTSVQAQTINAETAETRFLSQTGVTQAWARGITGRGSTIGIIDNGFDLTHSDLRNKVLAARSFTSNSITWGSHGTAMASIAAGAKNSVGTVGVAPDAQLLLAQVGVGGTNLELRPTAVKLALDWLSQQRATVINMSFGAAYDTAFTSRVRYDSLTKSYVGPALQNNIADFKVATDRGSILVTAAGNQGLPYSQAPAIYSVQTDTSGRLTLSGRSIIVGAVDASNRIASYSNRAGHLCQTVVANSCRDTVPTMYYYVVAPGSGLQAATANQLGRGVNTAYAISGTSGAAAYVSGGIALMRQAWPTLAPERIVNIVLNTARDLGTPGVDTTYGRGLVDFDAATRPAGSLLVANQFKLGTGAATGARLSSTAMTGGIASKFTSTSILTSTQVIDEHGRNYTADLTRALFVRAPVYNSASPYLTSAVPVRYNSSDLDFTVFSAANGSALELAREFGPVRIGYQFGSQQESNGFLGNYGWGAFNLGNSSTTWSQLAVELALTQQWSAVANYGLGSTIVANSAQSMIQIVDPIATDTAYLGMTKMAVFGETDQFKFGIGYEPRVRHGQARVTTVTGYTYSEQDGQVVGDPIMETAQVNLAHARQYVAVVGYNTRVNKHGYMSTALTGNQYGHRLGVTFTWVQ